MEWYELNESDIFAMMIFDVTVHPKSTQPTHDDYIMAFSGEFKFYGLKSSKLSQKLIATFQLLFEENNTVLFTGVGVLPGYRRKGNGDRIINKIEELSNNNILTCDTKIDNIVMETLLIKHDYKILKHNKKWNTWIK